LIKGDDLLQLKSEPEILTEQSLDNLDGEQIKSETISINSECFKPPEFLVNVKPNEPDEKVKEKQSLDDIPSPNEDSQTFFDTIESPSNYVQEYFPVSLSSNQSLSLPDSLVETSANTDNVLKSPEETSDELINLISPGSYEFVFFLTHLLRNNLFFI